MEMSANVVQESGIKPNWFGSIHSSTKGLSSWSITNPTATLGKVEVKDMGLRSLLKSSRDLGMGLDYTVDTVFIYVTGLVVIPGKSRYLASQVEE